VSTATARRTAFDDFVDRWLARIRAWVEFVDRRGPILVTTAASFLILIYGIGSIVTLSIDGARLAFLVLFAIGDLFLILQIRRREKRLDLTFLALLGLDILAIAVLGALPEYFGLPSVNAAFHRSVPDVIIMIPLGTYSLVTSLFHLYGRTPRAEDLTRYPLFVVPTFLALGGYAFLLGELVYRGLATFDFALLVRPYLNDQIPYVIVDPEGHASPSLAIHLQSGFSNHLLGTLLLVVLTIIFALPIGVGTGVYLSEYAEGRLSEVVRFSTTALRAISPFTIGLTAVSLVTATRATFLALPISGYHWVNAAGKQTLILDPGSYLPAALAISLLVIPVIARATEEGCRSVPAGLREGSVALGASESYGLVRIVLPWALPNILTATLIGCAETAGSLAPILFLAGTGETGVGLFSRVTTLSWAIFGSVYSVSKPFRDNSRPYQYTEGLLLLVLALGLSILAVYLRRRFASRYQH
jgi:phosphate transport system permease protein